MINELNTELSKLVSKTLTKTTIAGNTIELWVECEPKSKDSKSFWIDPPWRIEKEKSIVASSADFPWDQEEDETDEEYKTRFKNACEQCYCIHETKIKELSFCAESADIKIKFENGYLLRSFTTWRSEESWFYTNRQTNKRFYVSANKIEITEPA